jgi:hypothetical protein
MTSEVVKNLQGAVTAPAWQPSRLDGTPLINKRKLFVRQNSVASRYMGMELAESDADVRSTVAANFVADLPSTANGYFMCNYDVDFLHPGVGGGAGPDPGPGGSHYTMDTITCSAVTPPGYVEPYSMKFDPIANALFSTDPTNLYLLRCNAQGYLWMQWEIGNLADGLAATEIVRITNINTREYQNAAWFTGVSSSVGVAGYLAVNSGDRIAISSDVSSFVTDANLQLTFFLAQPTLSAPAYAKRMIPVHNIVVHYSATIDTIAGSNFLFVTKVTAAALNDPTTRTVNDRLRVARAAAVMVVVKANTDLSGVNPAVRFDGVAGTSIINGWDAVHNLYTMVYTGNVTVSSPYGIQVYTSGVVAATTFNTYVTVHGTI